MTPASTPASTPGSTPGSTRVSFARREREALCDLALEVGPSAPTLCEGWQTADLLAHLIVRERRPWLAGGVVLAPLGRLTDRAVASLRTRPLTELVDRLRHVPLPLRPVDTALNTLELFVHHEDLRRGSPGWAPRRLDGADEQTLLGMIGGTGRLLVRSAGVPVVVSAGDRRLTLRRGADPVVVSGPVSEVVLFLFGRAAVEGVVLEGRPDRVERLRSARLGV